MFWRRRRRKPKIIEQHYCKNLLITLKLLNNDEDEYCAVDYLSKGPDIIHFVMRLRKNDKAIRDIKDLFCEDNDNMISFFHPDHHVVALIEFWDGGQMWVHM